MKKVFYIALAALLFIGLSCAKKESTLTFMHFWTSEDVKPVINDLVAHFEAENPGIKVQLIDLNWSGGHDKITISFATFAINIKEKNCHMQFLLRSFLYDCCRLDIFVYKKR